jgi:hypothetical protein
MKTTLVAKPQICVASFSTAWDQVFILHVAVFKGNVSAVLVSTK